MAKRKMTRKGRIEGTATAKFEAVAKATYQRRKTTTEVVPPDVTRAKAGAWLDLISPLTEWAGLKGDGLRYRRQQLRIQQEETLVSLASLLFKKMDGKVLRRLVPLKILIPALEKASLEHPDDEYMIERWANLLAASATEAGVEPRFVSMLGELTNSQAKLLEEIFFKEHRSHPDKLNFDWIICELDEPYLQRFFKRAPKEGASSKKFWAELHEIFENRGLLLLYYSESLLSSQGRIARSYFQSPRQLGIDVDILRSLHLVELKKFTCEVNGTIFDLNYFQITDAGLNFLSACSPRVRDVLAELAKDKSGRFFPPSRDGDP